MATGVWIPAFAGMTGPSAGKPARSERCWVSPKFRDAGVDRNRRGSADSCPRRNGAPVERQHGLPELRRRTGRPRPLLSLVRRSPTALRRLMPMRPHRLASEGTGPASPETGDSASRDAELRELRASRKRDDRRTGPAVAEAVGFGKGRRIRCLRAQPQPSAPATPRTTTSDNPGRACRPHQ